MVFLSQTTVFWKYINIFLAFYMYILIQKKGTVLTHNNANYSDRTKFWHMWIILYIMIC